MQGTFIVHYDVNLTSKGLLCPSIMLHSYEKIAPGMKKISGTIRAESLELALGQRHHVLEIIRDINDIMWTGNVLGP